MASLHKRIAGDDSATFFCFSPPVMIATCVIELSLALYTLLRFKLTAVSRLAIAILVLLAVFQLAEYNVCEAAFGLSSVQWARLGYVAITLLPPLGIHLGLTIAGRKTRFLWLAYGLAAIFAAVFLFGAAGLDSSRCLGNYVIFQIAPWAVWPYTAYYYGWLILGIFLAWRDGVRSKKPMVRRALYCLALGYVSFLLPTTIATSLQPETLAGIPSIMCGFAVLFALTLAIGVLPNSVSLRKKVAKRS